MTTAAEERFAVRVMVTSVWDHVFLPVDANTTAAQLKREALRAALKRSTVNPNDFVLKFRGAEVSDESLTLGRLGVVPNAPFIVLPARRQPVR